MVPSQFQASTDQLQTLRENTCLFSGVYTLSNVNQAALLSPPSGHICFLTVALAFAQVQTTQENLVQVFLRKHLIPKDQVLIKPRKSLLLFLFNFTYEALYKLNHKVFSRYALLLMLTRQQATHIWLSNIIVIVKERSLKSTRRPKFRKMFLTACYNVRKPRKEMASDSSVAALKFQ